MPVKLKHLVLFLFLLANTAFCCDPEPGVQHFPTLEIPQPRIRTGYFQVHNRLNGLPGNEILSVIEHPTDQGNFVIAGSKDRGIMVFTKQQWYASNDPSGKIKFPETTVTSLVSASPDLIYAGTPLGLISIKISNDCFLADKIYSASPENLNVTDILIVKKDDGPIQQLLVACDRSVGNFISETYTSFSVPDHIIPSGFNAVGRHGEMLLAGWSNGLLEISGQRLESFVIENDPCGWVTDIQSRGDFFYASSANGLFKINSARVFENMLPGIWTTCFTFTADPGEKPASASEKVAIEDSTGISAEDSPEYQHLLNEYNQLQQDFQDYVDRNSNNRFASQGEVDAMWQRFSGFETKKRELMGDGVTVKNTMAKGLWIGTKENGVIMYDKTGMNYHLTMENSKLPSDNVTCMCSNEEGEVWIGTENGGLLHYSKQNQKGNQTEKLLEACKPI
ncbi:MAG: two-component regulator propeller domain-containing protein, partial [Candidatus Riflebacteria bacterium]